MRRVMLIVLALVASLGITASTATTASTEAGVTATSIKIGGTFPLSGPASLYATIPVAMKAYFSYINARRGPDGKRGVYGRQIVWNYKDDQYSPPNAVQLTRGLVEQDNVFAIVGSLGTEVNLAIRPYLNSKKVPHMLVSTGATTWGADWKQFPYTTGWQPAYQLEGRFYGEAIARNSPNAKIGVLYQNDDYGKDYIKGLEAGLGAKASNIVDKEPFEVTAPSVASQIVKLRGSGATIFVILATPTKTIQAYATANALKFSPAVIYTNSVSATDTFLTLAKANGGGDLVNRTFTTQYAKDPANPKWDNDAAHEALQAGHGEVLPQGPRHRWPQPLRCRHRRGLRRAALRRRQESDARLADEGVPDLEPGEPLPAAGRQAAEQRHEPVPDQVRAARQVHGRHVQARVLDEVLDLGHLARTRQEARSRGPASPAPSSFSGPARTLPR